MPVQKTPSSKFHIIHKRMAGEMFSMFLLWLLSKGKSHGYELIKKLNAEHNTNTISSAHVYPVLKSMMKKGWISSCQEKTGRRIRKCYIITGAGTEKLRQLKRIFFGAGLRKQFFREMIS